MTTLNDDKCFLTKLLGASQFKDFVQLIRFEKSGKTMFYFNFKTHYITVYRKNCKFLFYNDNFFSKKRFLANFFCRLAVCLDPLVVSVNKVLRYAADFVKMIRIIVILCIRESSKKLKLPIFITAIAAEAYFKAGFENFLLFCRVKISDFFSELELIQKLLF